VVETRAAQSIDWDGRFLVVKPCDRMKWLRLGTREPSRMRGQVAATAMNSLGECLRASVRRDSRGRAPLSRRQPGEDGAL